MLVLQWYYPYIRRNGNMNLSDEKLEELSEVLKDVTRELERQNDLKKKNILMKAADEIRPYQPNIALVLDELAK